VLLDREREIGAALDGRVVGDDHALAPRDAPDTGDDARARRLAAVHAVRGELPDLEERRAGVEQRAHPLARQELPAPDVLFARLVAAAQRRARDLLAQVLDQSAHALGVGAEFGRAGVELRLDDGHRGYPRSSARPITRRWMSLAPS
jgi:hypothetical protein